MIINEIIKKQRVFFEHGETKDKDFRLLKLRKLLVTVEEKEEEISKALELDLGKSDIESYLTEISVVKNELKLFIQKLKKWSKVKRVRSPVNQFPSRSYIYKEPYGVVLVLAPWNYPFQLALVPIIGAIASGNTAILKTSKNSPNTTEIIEVILSTVFSKEHVYLISKDVNYDDILKEKYDFIFFTGSKNVGKIIMEAASKNLTPMVLELGGKSPCIVDKTADLEVSAKRIVWGKLLNAGQTCVAPDYILAEEAIKEKLIKFIIKEAKKLYGNNVIENSEYPKIINNHHFKRLLDIIRTEKEILGGSYDENRLKIELSIIPNSSFNDDVMKDEIFGPILPVISYENIDDAILEIRKKDRPLALYLFTKDNYLEKKILREISFGGGCVNDTIVHLINANLPFGGVGASGMGSYHGEKSFETFSHKKSILKKAFWLDLSLRYPPYSERVKKLLKKIM